MDKEIDAIFGTEEKSTHYSYNKHLSFRDYHAECPTDLVCTNTEFALSGSASKAHFKVRNLYDFSSGISAFRTTQSGQDGREYEKLVVLDVGTFVKAFSRPKYFAQKLENRAHSLVKEWHERNALKRAVDREFVGYNFKLNEHSFFNSGKLETTKVELSLSSYGFTKKHKEDDHALLELEDLNVSIRLRTTKKTFKSMKGDEEEERKDEDRPYYFVGLSYTVPVLHFLGMLRHKSMEDLIEEVNNLECETKRKQNELEAMNKAAATSFAVPSGAGADHDYVRRGQGAEFGEVQSAKGVPPLRLKRRWGQPAVDGGVGVGSSDEKAPPSGSSWAVSGNDDAADKTSSVETRSQRFPYPVATANGRFPYPVATLASPTSPPPTPPPSADDGSDDKEYQIKEDDEEAVVDAETGHHKESKRVRFLRETDAASQSLLPD
jgi:hypothetical protein